MTFKSALKTIWRYPLCNYYRRKLKSARFTIISSDCIGGCLYHDLGLKFTSPTINLLIPRSLEFFEQLDYYLQIAPIPYGYSLKGEPIALLGNIEIIGVHYQNHDELIEKWNKRKKRIVWENVILITNSRFVSSKTDVERFLRLPYRKVIFTGEETSHDCMVYAPALKNGADLTAYCDCLGRRYFQKYLDCIKFINESVE